MNDRLLVAIAEIVSIAIVVIGAAWKIARSVDHRMTKLEAMLEPMIRLFGGNGQPALDVRLDRLERQARTEARRAETP